MKSPVGRQSLTLAHGIGFGSKRGMGKLSRWRNMKCRPRSGQPPSPTSTQARSGGVISQKIAAQLAAMGEPRSSNATSATRDFERCAESLLAGHVRCCSQAFLPQHRPIPNTFQTSFPASTQASASKYGQSIAGEALLSPRLRPAFPRREEVPDESRGRGSCAVFHHQRQV